ncbi:hypothetical protein [Thermoleptolyngbya sp.]
MPEAAGRQSRAIAISRDRQQLSPYFTGDHFTGDRPSTVAWLMGSCISHIEARA